MLKYLILFLVCFTIIIQLAKLKKKNSFVVNTFNQAINFGNQKNINVKKHIHESFDVSEIKTIAVKQSFINQSAGIIQNKFSNFDSKFQGTTTLDPSDINLLKQCCELVIDLLDWKIYHLVKIAVNEYIVQKNSTNLTPQKSTERTQIESALNTTVWYTNDTLTNYGYNSLNDSFLKNDINIKIFIESFIKPLLNYYLGKINNNVYRTTISNKIKEKITNFESIVDVPVNYTLVNDVDNHNILN